MKAIVIALLLIPSLVFATNAPLIQQSTTPSQGFFSSAWEFIKGTTPSNRFYLGMWNYHTSKEARKTDNENSMQVGATYNGWFALTFKNSYYDQTYGIGVQRQLYQYQFNNNTDFNIGYRAGLIYGYDGRMLPIAGTLKVLPAVLPYVDFRYRRLGVEFQYFFAATTVSFYFRFN